MNKIFLKIAKLFVKLYTKSSKKKIGKISFISKEYYDEWEFEIEGIVLLQ